MYNPSPFLISSAALTSIFSFFFGGYFREREKAYRLWIRYMAYKPCSCSEGEKTNLCAELESKERVFRQAKGILKILLFTLLVEFIVFQFYSWQYVFQSASYYEPDAMHSYKMFNAIIGVILLINCFEMVYIRVAVDRSRRFPFFSVRKRVTGQDRLSMLWRKFKCSELKNEKYDAFNIPEKFYRDKDKDSAGV